MDLSALIFEADFSGLCGFNTENIHKIALYKPTQNGFAYLFEIRSP
jgi:hypothetical protein